MEDLTHFDMIPLQVDQKTRVVSCDSSSSRALAAELEQLNILHRTVAALDNPGGAPPAPIPVNPKRTAGVAKLRDAGNNEYRKGRFVDAIKVYSLGIQMALGRPMWEPAALLRDEVAGLLANRAQAHMALQNWAEGGVDAHASVEAKRVGNAKAYWRRGRCLAEMGRLDEARDWVKRGLEVEGEEADLVGLLKDIEEKLEKAQDD